MLRDKRRLYYAIATYVLVASGCVTGSRAPTLPGEWVEAMRQASTKVDVSGAYSIDGDAIGALGQTRVNERELRGLLNLPPARSNGARTFSLKQVGKDSLELTYPGEPLQATAVLRIEVDRESRFVILSHETKKSDGLNVTNIHRLIKGADGSLYGENATIYTGVSWLVLPVPTHVKDGVLYRFPATAIPAPGTSPK